MNRQSTHACKYGSLYVTVTVLECSKVMRPRGVECFRVMRPRGDKCITLAPSSLKNSSRIQEFSDQDDPELAGSVEGSDLACRRVPSVACERYPCGHEPADKPNRVKIVVPQHSEEATASPWERGQT